MKKLSMNAQEKSSRELNLTQLMIHPRLHELTRILDIHQIKISEKDNVIFNEARIAPMNLAAVS